MGCNLYPQCAWVARGLAIPSMIDNLHAFVGPELLNESQGGQSLPPSAHKPS
jgi:hypothetical protein